MKNDEHSGDEVLRNQNHFSCDPYTLSYSGRKSGAGKTISLQDNFIVIWRFFYFIFIFILHIFVIVQLSMQLHFTAGHSCIRNNIINVPAPKLADFFSRHCHVSTSSLLKLILVESVIVRVVLREGHGSSSGVWWQNSSTTPCHLKKKPLSTAVQEVCTFVCKSCPQTPLTLPIDRSKKHRLVLLTDR